MMPADPTLQLPQVLAANRSTKSFYQAYSIPLGDEATPAARPFHDSFEQSSRTIHSEDSYADVRKPPRPYDSFEQSSRSMYSEDSYADVRKPTYSGLARSGENSAASFYSASVDDLQYPTKPKPNLHKFIKPVNSRDRSVLTREPSAGSKSFYSRSASDRSGFSHGYDQPKGDEYYRYEDDDEYTRDEGTYYDDRTRDDGTYYDPRHASRGQESFVSRGDEYSMYESIASRGGRMYDRYGGGGTRESGLSTPYSATKPPLDSDDYSDVESFYDESLPPQRSKSARYYLPS